MVDGFNIALPPAEPAELGVRIAALAADLQDSQAELIKARVDIAGSLSGDTAQDVDSLLGIIVASLDVLTGQLKADPDSAELAQDALAAAFRCADLAHQLLALADRPRHHDSSPADGAVDAIEAADVPAEGRRPATILAVDDNAGVRRVVVRQLTDLGYRILEAEDGPAALMILNSEPVDLLFTDVVMPGGMSGFDLARLVLARWPGMRALITSGFPHLEPTDDSAKTGKLRRLIKPYRKADLASALREVLDAEPDDLRKP
ncbi:MAG: response regulator [Devosia nanyangense]|uniref:Response regulator n=1 Tax=Devosia nanyangense TaxID=1228055 RepID=A0A933L5M2_9HYPH|nr:response regulator [Devosia nanyangense]